MPSKPKSFRNNIATTRIGDQVLSVAVNSAPTNVMPSMPDGLVGFYVRCASATVYTHGTVNSDAPNVRFKLAASGVESNYQQVAQANRLHLSCSVDSSYVQILPVVGIAN